MIELVAVALLVWCAVIAVIERREIPHWLGDPE